MSNYIIGVKIRTNLVSTGVLIASLILISGRLAEFTYANIGFIMVNQALVSEDADINWLSSIRWLEKTNMDAARRGIGFALEALDQESAAVAAWQRAGEGSEDFLVRGKNARETGNIKTAVTWFNRAVAANRNLADPWYELGLTYEFLEDTGKAIATYEQGLTKTKFLQIGLSDFYLRLGVVHSTLMEPVDLETAINYYDQALVKNNFGDGTNEVRTHYLKAEALSRSGEITKAVDEYEWVIAKQPEHYWAYVRLGLLIWNVQQDADTAEALLLQAVSLNDQQKMAYRGLGVIYIETGQKNEAISVYQKILMLDTTDTNAREALSILGQ